jgi:sortase (surface protein transpeptidase)
MIAAAIFIVGDVGLLVDQIFVESQRQHIIKAQVASLGIANIPSSKKPSDQEVAAYKVPAAYPRYLVIPTLKIKTEVTQLILDQHNQIQSPNNIYNAGWYTGSSLPGQPGATFIDGHVASWTANGVFANLKTLQPGDTMQIIRGDNSTLTYTVKKLTVYDASNVDMKQALSPIVAGASGLNIMTCTGSISNGAYTQRLVVYATLNTKTT